MDINSDFLSLIIPCYNEEKNIPFVFSKAKQLLEASNDIEIIFVNNGSSDNSEWVFNEEQARVKTDRIRVVSVPENKGYGYGILYGLNQAKGSFLGWTHADLQTDIFDCIKGYYILKAYSNLNMVKGSRVQRPPLDKFFSLGMSIYVYLKLKSWISEINAQPKLFRRIFFDRIKENAPFDFSIDLYFLLHAFSSGKVKSFPVRFEKRLHGTAKGGSGSLKLKTAIVKRTIWYVNNYKL